MLWRRLCLAQESEVRREIGGVAVFVAHYRCPSARILVAAARLAFLFCPCGNPKSHPAFSFCPRLSTKSIAPGKDSDCQTR